MLKDIAQFAEQFWPQFLAFLLAFFGSLAINYVVSKIKQIGGDNPHVRRWLPAIPGIIGGIGGPFVWPLIMQLAASGFKELATIEWASYWMGMLLMGIAQGAISANLHKFWTQTILGKDGVLGKALFKILEKL